MHFTLRCFLLCLPLAACGGSGHHSDATPNKKTDYSTLSEQKLEPGPLRQASTQELELLIKNGLRVSLKNSHNYETYIRNASINTLATDVKAGTNNHSVTNVQVEGVEEADTVKYDGHYIYVATPTTYTESGPTTSIKIFATDASNAKTREVSTTTLDANQWGNVSELYLMGNEQASTELVAVRRSWGNIALVDDVAKIGLIAPNYFKQGINIQLYDVLTPATPTKTWSLNIDGNLISTRKIGNKLYIVSSFAPYLATLDYSAGTDSASETSSKESSTSARIQNENLIAKTPIEKLLPEYAVNDGSPQPLIRSSGCLIANDTDKNQGYLNIVNITTVNLSSRQVINSVCMNTNTDGIYASLNNIYLGGSNYADWRDWKNFTVIHKFSLADAGAEYEASGAVEGYLGWNQPSLRMDENNDYLRIITTDYNNPFEPKHHLSVLQKVAGRSELEIVARLPNDTHPEPIGKPREDIYSVRFNGDKAYVVTFERKDPLYVLDLTHPTDPKLAGQLEVPGVSTYLHPVGDKYLFSLGNETDINGRQTGVKVSLFDIRDMTKPTLINTQVFNSNNIWSNALYDYHAISFLQINDDQLRITFPTTEIDSTAFEPYSSNTRNSLKLFEINGLTQNLAHLDFAGELESTPLLDYTFWDTGGRGILHNNAVFYVQGAAVTSRMWWLPD